MASFKQSWTVWQKQMLCDVTIYKAKGMPLRVELMEYKDGSWWTKIVHVDSDPNTGEMNLTGDRMKVLAAILRSIEKRKRSI